MHDIPSEAPARILSQKVKVGTSAYLTNMLPAEGRVTMMLLSGCYTWVIAKERMST